MQSSQVVARHTPQLCRQLNTENFVLQHWIMHTDTAPISSGDGAGAIGVGPGGNDGGYSSMDPWTNSGPQYSRHALRRVVATSSTARCCARRLSLAARDVTGVEQLARKLVELLVVVVGRPDLRIQLLVRRRVL